MLVRERGKNFYGFLSFLLGLNMFLVPIKLGTSKFSPYLILIGFLVLTKKYLLPILVPVTTKFV